MPKARTKRAPRAMKPKTTGTSQGFSRERKKARSSEKKFISTFASTSLRPKGTKAASAKYAKKFFPLVTGRWECGDHPKATESAGPMNKKNVPAACSGTKRHRQTCFGHSEEKSPRSSVPKKKQLMKQDDPVMPSPRVHKTVPQDIGNSPKARIQEDYIPEPPLCPILLLPRGDRPNACRVRSGVGGHTLWRKPDFSHKVCFYRSMPSRAVFLTLKMTNDPCRPICTGEKKSLHF
jgi:hypothetical protein